MLKEAVETYLAIRRATGFKLQDDAWYLASFAQLASAQGETHIVAQTAITWAGLARSESQRAVRLQAVIRFARFSRATDTRHELPPQGVFSPRRQRSVPYLFSQEEIQALMSHAAQLGPPGSFRPQMYSTLIGLLAATGMRISEALGVCFRDITPDGLVIRETKFRKSRLVPLHSTTRAALEACVTQRTQLATDDEQVFVSLRRRPLSRTTVYPTFTRLLAATGVPRTSGHSKPRLIDLRHTFATNVLLASPESRDHIGRHMLALTTYLGHAHVSSTYWYLESTPQLMGDIIQACERFIEENTP
ncbi:MAG: tyrosine-type recombinase/integrase [Candidatus Tectimicrobiota bacterium]